MSITVEPTEIPEVLVIKPRVFRDPRGFFMETFHAEKYAEAGIPEYWIVDPQKRVITVLVLADAVYRVHGEFTPEQQATSVLLGGFAVDVAEVFAAAK